MNHKKHFLELSDFRKMQARIETKFHSTEAYSTIENISDRDFCGKIPAISYGELETF